VKCRSMATHGELDNKLTQRVERLRQCFARAKVSVDVPADIAKALWDRFLTATSFGGVAQKSGRQHSHLGTAVLIVLPHGAGNPST
jgi:hypothetical protein